MYTEDEEEEEEENQEGYSCVDSNERLQVTCGKETHVFLQNDEGHQRTHSYSEEFISHEESLNEEESEEKHYSETLSLHNSAQVSDFENEEAETVQVDFPARDADSAQVERRTTSPINLTAYKRNKNRDGISHYN